MRVTSEGENILLFYSPLDESCKIKLKYLSVCGSVLLVILIVGYCKVVKDWPVRCGLGISGGLGL